MKTPFALEDGEEVLHSEAAVYIKSTWKKAPGVLYLTNKRLVFYKNGSLYLRSFALLGILIENIFSGYFKKVLFNLHFGGVVGYWKGKIAINKTKLMRVDSGNGTVLTFATTKKFEDWDEKLTPHIPHLTEKDEV